MFHHCQESSEFTRLGLRGRALELLSQRLVNQLTEDLDDPRSAALGTLDLIKPIVTAALIPEAVLRSPTKSGRS